MIGFTYHHLSDIFLLLLDNVSVTVPLKIYLKPEWLVLHTGPVLPIGGKNFDAYLKIFSLLQIIIYLFIHFLNYSIYNCWTLTDILRNHSRENCWRQNKINLRVFDHSWCSRVANISVCVTPLASLCVTWPACMCYTLTFCHTYCIYTYRMVFTKDSYFHEQH
jgi:hypothetical protein